MTTRSLVRLPTTAALAAVTLGDLWTMGPPGPCAATGRPPLTPTSEGIR